MFFCAAGLLVPPRSHEREESRSFDIHDLLRRQDDEMASDLLPEVAVHVLATYIVVVGHEESRRSKTRQRRMHKRHNIKNNRPAPLVCILQLAYCIGPTLAS